MARQMTRNWAAPALGCPMITANGHDFSRLYTAWAHAERQHLGIIIWAQLPPRLPGALAEAIVNLLAGRSTEDMANSIHHI